MVRLSGRTVSTALLGIVLAGCGGGGGDINPPGATAPTVVVQPLPLPGPYAVGCSNVSQDFSRVGSGEDAQSYWDGRPTADGSPRYVTDLLADPEDTLMATVTAPNDTNLYGSFAGQDVPFVVIACYPTTADNPRPDYPLPSGDNVPHMQTGPEAPLFADSSARYPVIAFSHGYGGNPISGAYLSGIATFASYGYVVIAPFHGDRRFTDLSINDFGDAITLLSHLSDFTALQAVRPLSISAALDLVLARPEWQGHVDTTQIGGFGASMGGETMMLLGGAGLTSSYPGLSWSQVTHDPRIKAAVGYVPYFGQPFLPAFGDDQHGLDGIGLPFLGISGTADTVAPILEVEIGMSRLAGTRELVALAGVQHGFDVASTNDIFTWTLTFLDGEVRGNPAAKMQLSTMASVAGGGDDSVVIYYNGLP
ncbi:MAG: alpha/beta hydrolase family protein [Gemmatimonadota bacterium]